MSGSTLPALRGATHSGVQAPREMSLPKGLPATLPPISGAHAEPRPAVRDASSSANEGGAKLRNLLGLSEAEQKEIADREQQMREKEALIAQAHAREKERLQEKDSRADAMKADAIARQAKRDAILQQLNVQKSVADEEKILEDRSPDKGPGEEVRYGYVSPSDSPRQGPSPRDPSQHYGYSSPLGSPAESPRPPENDFARAAAATAGSSMLTGMVRSGESSNKHGSKMTRRITMQAAAKKVVNSVRTPGFIMLDRLHQQAGKGLKNKQRDLWRLIKKHYAMIKKERQAEMKASGKMFLLKGDLKKRAMLTEKLRCAVLAVFAARKEQGPQMFGNLSKALDAERMLQNSPEYKAVQCLQRAVRRAQPLKFHPGVGPSLPLAHALHVVWGAHVVLCRCAKARSTSDLAFLQRFLLRDQVRFMAAATDAETAAARLRRLYADGGRRSVYDAALVVDLSAKRALQNRRWVMFLWSGQEVARWVRTVQPRREYQQFPAISGAVRAFFPKAIATTSLANHATGLAQEMLSAGRFTLAKALLKVASSDLTMATSREEKRREFAAMTLVARRMTMYSKRFHTPAAKLRQEITALVAEIETRRAAGATAKHLAVSRNRVQDLRQQMASLVLSGAGVTSLVRALSRSSSVVTLGRSASMARTASAVDWERDMSFMNNDYYDNTFSGESDTESETDDDIWGGGSGGHASDGDGQGPDYYDDVRQTADHHDDDRQHRERNPGIRFREEPFEGNNGTDSSQEPVLESFASNMLAKMSLISAPRTLIAPPSPLNAITPNTSSANGEAVARGGEGARKDALLWAEEDLPQTLNPTEGEAHLMEILERQRLAKLARRQGHGVARQAGGASPLARLSSVSSVMSTESCGSVMTRYAR
jgi:hypothetical protein